jgi:acyl carrier protein
MDPAQKIREFIIENFLLGDARNLVDSQSLLRTGVFDSTGAMELITFLEATFQITVRDSEVVPANLDSISNIAGFLERKLMSKGGV